MQTITLVNKSGKVVNTGKHLVGVFNDAKSAYRDRKNELAVVRETKHSEKQARKAEQLALADTSGNASGSSSKRSRSSSKSEKSSKHGSDDSRASDQLRLSRGRPSALRNEYFVDDGHHHRNEIVRRHSDAARTLPDRPKTSRSASVNDIDMDLAYGELPPPLPLRRNDELDLRAKMSKLQTLLDEANCMQHSAIAIIENLQKNPDALAAVALTLGEISTVASKMAPGMLLALKSSFPAIVALLAAPEFLIAAGVGVGVTVIVLGGYKIVKKIKQRKETRRLLRLENGDADDDAFDQSSQAESGESFDELRELSADLKRIDAWRREIANAQLAGEGEAADSLATSVEGEFATPAASKYLIAEGVLDEEDAPSTKTSKSKKSSRSKKSGKVGDVPSTKTKKKKEASGLRMLFKTKS